MGAIQLARARLWAPGAAGPPTAVSLEPSSVKLSLHQLKSVPEWIRHVDTLVARKKTVFHDFDSGLAKAPREAFEVVHEEGGMRLLCRAKLRLDSEMNLHRSPLEPGAAPLCELGGFRDLGQTEEPRVESARLLLLALRHRKLNVLDAQDTRERGPSDAVDEILTTAGEVRAGEDAADLYDGPPRSHVLRADDENDAVHEPERMVEHEPLHLAVVPATPVRPRQERPADFDLAARLVVVGVARRPDDSSVAPVDCDQRPSRFECASEELPEDEFLVALVVRMLLPDQRIRSDGIQRVPVLRAER